MIKRAAGIAGLALLLVACGEPQLEVAVPLAIVNVSPHDGATGIDPQAKPIVCFNRDVSAAGATGFLQLEDEDSGEAISQGLATAGNARCLMIDHAGLKADTGYVLRASVGLPSSDGAELAAEVTSRFRTAR
jgi:hypothetical protein